MTMRWLLLAVGLWSMCLGAWAQDAATPAPDVQPGTRITGSLSDRAPRAVFYFEGSRGEVIRFQLTTTRGTLDPVMTVFDDQGAVIFSRDDARGSRDIRATVTIERTTRHFVVIGRFGYQLGSTEGDFELTLERVGVVSEQGTNLLYGIPVINTISNMQPQIYYTFQANQGDILSIQMIRSSGTLDPFLQVVDSNRFVVAENDDASGLSRNARIDNLVIQASGTYIVVATRYGQAAGESVGSFVLTLAQAENSGLGNSSLAPIALLTDQPVEDTLDNEVFERYYTFSAERDDLITVTLNQTRGQLDTALVIANAGLQPLISDDDSGGGRNARIERFRIPAAGTYFIVAQRADGATGRTSGTYRLLLERSGTAFAGVNPGIPRLDYGSVIQDSISSDDPDSVFAFWGNAGDVVTIAMNRASGDLDGVLELLDSAQRRLTSDDDGGGSQNARIAGYRLPAAAVYYIRAARYAGDTGSTTTTGTYNLILSRALD